MSAHRPQAHWIYAAVSRLEFYAFASCCRCIEWYDRELRVFKRVWKKREIERERERKKVFIRYLIFVQSGRRFHSLSKIGLGVLFRFGTYNFVQHVMPFCAIRPNLTIWCVMPSFYIKHLLWSSSALVRLEISGYYYGENLSVSHAKR